jgi:hypothetical protein
MTAQCPLCKSEIEDNNPAFGLNELGNWVRSKGGWSMFEGDTPSYGYPVGKEFQIEGKPATVVAKKVSYDSGDIDREGYYDNELPQGTTYAVYVVIQFAGGFFKKTGTADSYSEIAWDGELLPVTPKTKTIEVYDYA